MTSNVEHAHSDAGCTRRRRRSRGAARPLRSDAGPAGHRRHLRRSPISACAPRSHPWSGVSMLPTVAAGHRPPLGSEARTQATWSSTPSSPPTTIRRCPSPRPRWSPRCRAARRTPIAEYIAHGNVHNISFQSSFEPVNPDMRAAVEAAEAQQRCVGPALAPRRRAAPDPVRDPRLHGIGVSVQRPVLLAAVVLPHRLRRHALHVAVPRPPSRKGFALQRLRLLLPGHGRVRRDDGPGRPRLPLRAWTGCATPASTGSR